VSALGKGLGGVEIPYRKADVGAFASQLGISESEAEVYRKAKAAEAFAAGRAVKSAGGDLSVLEGRLAEITGQEVKTGEANLALDQQSLLTQEQIVQLEKDKAVALRSSIVKLESALGKQITQGGPEDTSNKDLANYERSLRNEMSFQNALAREATAAAVRENKERAAAAQRAAQLDPNNRGAVIADAQAEAKINAENREIAVLFGKEREKALYEQMRYNQSFIQNLGEERALQQARIGLEKSALATELGKDRAGPGGTTYKLRDDVVAGDVATTKEAAIQNASKAATLAADNEYVAAKAESAKAHVVESAKVAATLAADDSYIAAKVQAAEASVTERIAILAKTTEAQLAEQGRLAAMEVTSKEMVNSAKLEALMSEKALQAKAQGVIAQQEYNKALKLAIANELKSRGASQAEINAATATAVPKTADDSGAAGFFGGGLASTLRYALPSALLFGAVAGLSKSLKEAQELQKIFAQLDAQARSLGVNDTGVAKLKDDILDIAKASGTASPEVAHLAFQFQGAFGGDTQRTIKETQAAVEAVKVTGLSLTETTDAFTAITQSFGATNVSIRDITDTAIGLEERFGVLSKETIAFAADLAPVAAQIGFTTQELETLGAVAQKYSGRSGSQLADAFGRILPQLQENAVPILQIFEQIGNTKAVDNLSKAFATGQTGDAFKELLRNYTQLDKAQQNLVIAQLGGRREAQALIPVLQHADEFYRSLATGTGDAGKEALRYEEIQKTLSQQLAQLGEALKQVGIKLFQGGLGEALTTLAKSGRGIVDVLGVVLGAASSLNDALGGIPITLAVMLGAMKALGFVVDLTSKAFERLTGAQARQSKTAVENAAANETAAGAQAAEAGATNANATGGFFGNIAANYRTRQAARVGVTGLPGGIVEGAGGIGITTSTSALTAETAAASKSVGFFRGGMQKAADGIHSFADSIPKGLAFAAAALAIGDLITTVNEIRGTAAAAQNDLKQKILSGTPDDQRAKIAKLRAQQANFSGFESFAGTISGYDSPGTQADSLDAQVNSKGNAAGLDALYNYLKQNGFKNSKGNSVQGIYSQELQTLRDKINKGTATDSDFKEAQKILDEAKDFDSDFYNNVIAPKVAEAQRIADEAAKGDQNKSKQNTDAVAKIANASSDISTIKNQVSTGELSVGQGLSQIQSTIDSYERLLKESPDALKNIPDAEKHFNEAKKAKADLISKSLYNQVQDLKRFAEVNGREDPQADVTALEELLKNPNLNPEDRKKGTQDLLDAYKKLYDFKVKGATSVEELQKLIKDGIPISDEARGQLMKEQIDSADAEFHQFIMTQSGDVQQVISESTGSIAMLMAQTGDGINKATATVLNARAVIDEERANALEAIKNNEQALHDAGFVNKDSAEKEIQRLRDDAAASRVAAQNAQSSNLGPNPNVPGSGKFGTPTEDAKNIADLANARREYLKSLSGGDAVAAAQSDLSALQAQLASIPQGTKEWYELAAKVNAAQRTLDQALKARADGHFDVLKAMHEGDSVAQSNIELQQAVYDLAQATPDEREAAQARVISAQNSVQRSNQQRIQSEYDYYKALNSKDPVAVAKIELAAAQQALANAKPDEWNAARARVVQAQEALDQAAEDTLQAYYSYMQQVFSDNPAVADQYALIAANESLAKAVPGTREYYDALSKIDQVHKKQKQESDSYNQAYFSYLQAFYADDPVLAAQAAVLAAQNAVQQAKPGTQEMLAAQTQLLNAQRQERQAQQEIEKARLELNGALVSGDPVKAARAAKAQAQYDFDHAKGEAERIRAFIALMNANRQLQDAMSEVFSAQSDLVSAQLDYVGDTVGVAQVGLKEAQRKLAEVQAKYQSGQAGEADIAKAKADVIRATGAARDARIKKSEDDYAFQFEMGQITKSQYIQYLEGLKSLADGNQEIIRDLDRKIHSLKGELSADLQFNLPTNIGLPTLYEARRLNQSVNPVNGQPVGYQDMRNVQVNITVNSGMDVQQVKTVLQDALGGGRVGSQPRRY
jgi:hypothetical protein